MKFELRAAFIHESHKRCAGETTAAFWVTTDDGQEGWAFFVYEWDGRDVTTESLTTEPHIAAAVREEIPEEGPSVLNAFCIHESKGDTAVLTEAQEKATEVVYDYC